MHFKLQPSNYFLIAIFPLIANNEVSGGPGSEDQISLSPSKLYQMAKIWPSACLRWWPDFAWCAVPIRRIKLKLIVL